MAGELSENHASKMSPPVSVFARVVALDTPVKPEKRGLIDLSVQATYWLSFHPYSETPFSRTMVGYRWRIGRKPEQRALRRSVRRPPHLSVPMGVYRIRSNAWRYICSSFA